MYDSERIHGRIVGRPNLKESSFTSTKAARRENSSCIIRHGSKEDAHLPRKRKKSLYFIHTISSLFAKHLLIFSAQEKELFIEDIPNIDKNASLPPYSGHDVKSTKSIRIVLG